MIKVAIIGLGNAGNQIADLASIESSIPAIAINSSEKDLSTLKKVTRINVGTQGSGKDRGIAKKYIKNNFMKLVEAEDLCELIQANDVIFVISSTGGGSGSGTAPMLYELLNKLHPKKKFILVGILPELRESIASQQNTIEYLKEVKSIEGITYMLYDNNRKGDLKGSLTLKAINNEVIEDIKIIRGDYQFSTPYNSIDECDMMKILNTTNMINVTKLYDIKEKDLDKKTIEDMLIDYLKNESTMCEVERDGIVKRMGLIINIVEKLQPHIDRELVKLKNVVGEAVEEFEHEYIYEDKNQVNRIILILSGLSIPDDRINKILERMEEAMEAISKSKEGSLLDVYENEDINGLRKDEEKEINEEVDVNSIFDKFM